jgi:hypothetical protein
MTNCKSCASSHLQQTLSNVLNRNGSGTSGTMLEEGTIPGRSASKQPCASPNSRPPDAHAYGTAQTLQYTPRKPLAPRPPTTPAQRRSTLLIKSHPLLCLSVTCFVRLRSAIVTILTNLLPITMTQKWNLLHLQIHISHCQVAHIPSHHLSQSKECRILETWPNTA